jgi:hypothetical protein
MNAGELATLCRELEIVADAWRTDGEAPRLVALLQRAAAAIHKLERARDLMKARAIKAEAEAFALSAKDRLDPQFK